MTIDSARASEPHFPRPSIRGGALLLLSLLVLGAAPPDVVRIRVPAEKVGTWFPAETELRGLSAEQLDSLVKEAREGYRRQAGQAPARLLSARHFARWNAGLLTGRSELVVEAPTGLSRPELILSPWSPAIEAAGGGVSRLRMHDDGRTAIRIDAGPVSTLTLKWQLRARPGSQGRGFTLDLPDTVTSRLSLDLPKDWTPEGPGGIRVGPEPAREPGRTHWQFDGRGGRIDLQLHGRPTDDDAVQEPRAWVSGPTRIELGDALANWTMEWTVDLDPRAPRRIQVELDEGLDFTSVTGPGIEESRAEVVDKLTRVTVLFDGQVSGPTPVVFRAVSRVPSEGPWSVPAARPLDALWTGGKTSIQLDPSRVLSDCRADAGRLVPSRPTGEASDPNLLVFEADEPRSVAILSFGKPRLDVSVEVRGQLLLGNSAPRLECQLTWRVHRGRLLALDVDLPAAWVPERVHVVGIDEPLAWHPRMLPGGGVRVHVTPPSGDFARSSLVLQLAASAAIAGGRGPITLPRVRPVGAQVVDERWLAWTESGVTLHPAKVSGLAWIDPSLVIGPANDRSDIPAGLREALAWRWIADQAEARVNRERVEEEPRGSIQLLARVDRDRLRLDWRISVDLAEDPLRTLPIGVPQPIPGAEDWQFFDETTATELPRKPIESGRRAGLGMPETGEAWELAIPDSRSGRVVVRCRADLPWRGQGPLPLLVMPARFQARHFVMVDVAQNLQASVESSGLQDLEPTVAEAAIKIRDRGEDQDRLGTDPVPWRRAYAFSYSKPGGRLELRTEALEPVPSPGLIDEAVLTTFIDPQGPLRHRLTLRVSLADARALELTLPRGTTLIRVKRDGQPVAPSRTARALSLALPVPTPARGSCSFVLDYLTPRRGSAANDRYEPERPSASLPCLSFRWEAIIPEPWVIADHEPTLAAGDPFATPTGLRRFLPRWMGSTKAVSKAELESLRSLDLRAADLTTTEMTLGDCLTRWDAGASPLVIDRMALASSGVGPESRVSPLKSRDRQGTTRALLGPLGLALVPIGDAVLVTTSGEAPDRTGGPFRDPGAKAAWEASVRRTIVSGSDASDRFQNVNRWRGEWSRRVQYGGETTDIDPTPNGRRIWRFASTGWPKSGASIHLVNEQRERATAWTAGLMILAIGIACRRLAPDRVASGLAILLLGSTLALTFTAPRPSAIAAGGMVGSLAVGFFLLGRSLPLRLRRRRRDTRSPGTRPRSNSGLVSNRMLILAVVAAASSIRLLAAVAGDDASIVALYPFEGAPDPSRTPDRAVIRLEDYKRLRALADSRKEESPQGVAAVGASHRVTWQGAGGVVIDSEFELIVDDTGPVSWTFPVGKARDLSATLDDVDVPVQVQPGGQTASITIAGKQRTVLRLRRFVTPRRLDDAESISIAINPMAAARIEVGPGPAGRRIEVPNARGDVTPRAGGTAGSLGPADRLEVRWVATNEQERRPATGAVDGLLLWDAEPAGDRIRARLTFRNPEGTSVIRLRLDPGIVVRSSLIPGQSDAGLHLTAQGIEWVAHVNPPMPDGTTVRLELWRTQPFGHDNEAPAERSLPRIEPVGAESYSGAVAFRRPADWAGRLPAAVASDPITEEAFVRMWGNLPEEPLTLSGVSRFVRSSVMSVRMGPVPSRLGVQPVVELSLGPGRVEMSLDAKINQLTGRSYQVECEVPEALQIIRIEGDGLTDWSRSARRVRLRFDGAPFKQRQVRLQGWLPVAYDPLATGRTRQEIAVPWPSWQDVDLLPGSLIVASETAFDLAAREGVTPSSPDLEDPGLSKVRNTYRVERSEDLGLIRWEVEPARVDVQVRSQLTINPQSAEWVAVLRYGVAGGACDTIQLELPTAWADSAGVTLAGVSHQLTAESRGETTYLTIRPEQPIWGSQDLTVRSVRSLAETSSLRFPDLEPTVNGTTEIDLAIVNASGREFTTGGSPGLQPIDDSSRFRTEEFSPLPGLPSSFFRVKSKDWSLKVEAPGGTALASGPGSGLVQTPFSEVESLLADDESSMGSLRCRIEKRSGPFYTLSLPPGTSPVWVSVGGKPCEPLRAVSGRWLIPLDERSSSELLVIWKSAAPGTRLLGGRTIPLPVIDGQRIPTYLSLRTPPAWEVTSRNPALMPVASDRQEISRAERLGRLIIDRLSTIDRSSSVDREELVASLVDFELRLRSGERAAVWGDPTPSATRDAQVQGLRTRARAARQELNDAVETAALDELARAARVHLGLIRDDSPETTVAIPDPAVSVRLRKIGQPHRFEGELEGKADSPPLTALPEPPAWVVEPAQAVPYLWAAILLPPVVWTSIRRTGRPGPGIGVFLALGLAIAALGGGFCAFLAAFGMAGLGWLAQEGAIAFGPRGNGARSTV